MKVWLRGSLCVGIVAALQGAAVAATLRIVPVDPVPGGHIAAGRPAIEFEIHTASDTGVTRNQVHVSLDGSDASRDLQIAGSRLEIVPRKSLALGSHHVDVSVVDNSGEQAADGWSFTVDPQDAAVPTVQDDATASADTGYDNGASAVIEGDGYASSPYYGGYGYSGSGLFFPVGFGPYYYGEPLSFIYTGFGLGGFVTIPGFPGTYPLVPFAPNYYYVTVPVPSSYAGGTPVAVCNFPHNRRRLLSTGPVRIEHARRPAGSSAPAWVAPRWHPTLRSLATLPGTPWGLRQFVAEQTTREPQTGGVTFRRYGSVAEPRMLLVGPDRTPSLTRVAQPRLMEPRIVPSVPRVMPARSYVAPVAAPHFAPVAAPHFAPVAAPHFAPVAAPVMRRP